METTWSSAQNVLCVRLDALGDVLMTTPALRALKYSRPGRRLTVLTSTGGASVTPFIPEIDDVIVYDPPWMKATELRTDSAPEHAMAERLRRRGFDAAVVFTVYSQNPLPAAFLCYLADIPLRLAHCRENPYQLLTHWVPDYEPERLLRHEVRRQLDLVATIECQTTDERLSFQAPEAAHRSVAALLHRLGIAWQRPWVVIHPGASAPSRRYPVESYIETAQRLILELGCQVLFTGVAAEESLVAEIRAAINAPTFSLVDQLSVPEFAALLTRAPLLITNNTGPVHIAAAVGTPVVDLYALTNPQHTPWAVPHRVLFHDVPCKYCYKSICPTGHHQCLRGVHPADVVAAARELLNAGRADTLTSATLSAPVKERPECIPLG